VTHCPDGGGSSTFETSINVYHTTRLNIPEDSSKIFKPTAKNLQNYHMFKKYGIFNVSMGNGSGISLSSLYRRKKATPDVTRASLPV
jgi:hypothetical protein